MCYNVDVLKRHLHFLFEYKRGKSMTETEIIEHYQIPLEIIQEYEILKSDHSDAYDEH